MMMPDITNTTLPRTLIGMLKCKLGTNANYPKTGNQTTYQFFWGTRSVNLS